MLNNNDMKERVVSRKNQIRSIIFIIILMAITTRVLLKDYSIYSIIRVIKDVNPVYLTTGILMILIYIGCQALNFYILLKKLGKAVPFIHCLEYTFTGIYFSALTPGASGGQPAQVYYMEKDDIHVDLSAITIFFMVFASQAVILLIGGILSALNYPELIMTTKWLKYLLIAGSIVMLGLAFILAAFMFLGKTIPFLVNLGLRCFIALRLVKKPDIAKAQMEQLLCSYSQKAGMLLKHPALFMQVFLVSLIQWLAFYTVSYMIYLGFGHPEFGYFDLITDQALINIAIAAVPIPGSVGVAEKVYLLVLSRYYTEGELPSAMVLNRFITFYLPLFISFIAYMLTHIRITKKKRREQLSAANLNMAELNSEKD
jgi:uncharacterized protein (TIRG00374 family)